MTALSQNHPNRRSYNWLLYDIFDRSLKGYQKLYRGCLYDLGCGTSPYREFFLNYADQYIGIDWGASYHDIKADITADLNRILPIESEVADTVVSLSVIEHLYEPQIMLNEAFRILRPGGNIVLQAPWQWWIHEAPHDYFRYTPYGLKYLFEKAGFVDVYVESKSGFFTMLVLKMNYFSLRLVKGPKLIKWLIKACFLPFWYVGQIIAPHLDRLDRHWDAETCGYFVTARKSVA